MILGYNTNGLAHHRLPEALDLCAKLGYKGLAITLDVAHLDPFGDWRPQAKEIRAQAKALGLSLSVETGARFLLHPGRKHEPNLMSADESEAQRRVEFYLRCLEVSVALGSPLISLWSGALANGDTSSEEACFARLAKGLAPVVARGEQLGVRVAFEPEPGMFVETPEQYSRLRRVGGESLQSMGLTLDVGHCLVTGGELPQDAIRSYREEIIHVHLDDIRSGKHEHLMFGAGDLDLKAVLGALREVKFSGMAAVELSRDSHRGAEAARQAFDFLIQA